MFRRSVTAAANSGQTCVVWPRNVCSFPTKKERTTTTRRKNTYNERAKYTTTTTIIYINIYLQYVYREPTFTLCHLVKSAFLTVLLAFSLSRSLSRELNNARAGPRRDRSDGQPVHLFLFVIAPLPLSRAMCFPRVLPLGPAIVG